VQHTRTHACIDVHVEVVAGATHTYAHTHTHTHTSVNRCPWWWWWRWAVMGHVAHFQKSVLGHHTDKLQADVGNGVTSGHSAAQLNAK